jgi:hypothetical protein
MKIFTTQTIKETVEKHCRETKKIKDFTFHYLYVVSSIYIRPYLDRRFTEEDFIPVNMELLEQLISKKEAKTVIDNLIKLGIIETDNKVIIGSKSRGYKIVNRFKEKWFLTPINDQKLALKLRTKTETLNCDVNKRGKGYQVVNTWFEKLELDYSRAKKYIDNHYRKEYTSALNNNDLKNKAVYTYDSLITSIAMFKEDSKFICVDNKSNRLHYNLTNLSTELRRFLTVEGETLWNVDIANSQPTFLGLLMKKRKSVDQKEVDRYLEVCKQGQFYEYMAELGEVEIDLNDYKQRKTFKKGIFSGVLFDRNRKQLSKWEQTFEKVFPSIFKEVRKIKEKDYNAMAIMLQKEEATFIFKTIDSVNKILKGQAPLLTIHDSIVSTEENIYMVAQIMEESFREQYNFIPKLEPVKL